MYNEVFNISFKKLANWLVPTSLRKPILRAFVDAAFSALIILFNSFSRYRDAKKYELDINYETCRIEAFLNDRFDLSLRRIYIDDSENGEVIYLYQDEEEKPQLVYQPAEDVPLYIYTDGESIADVYNDFIVYVPAVLNISEAELRAMISTKISGKRYKIETF